MRYGAMCQARTKAVLLCAVYKPLSYYEQPRYMCHGLGVRAMLHTNSEAQS